MFTRAHALLAACSLALLTGTTRPLIAQPAGVELALPPDLVPGVLNGQLPDGAQVRMVVNGEEIDVAGSGPRGLGISPGDLERWARLLRLTPDQLSAAQTLREGAEADLSKATAEYDKQIADARAEMKEHQDRQGLTKLAPIYRDMRAKRDATQSQFFSDFKTLLTKEQEPRWPRLEMLRRREQAARGFSSIAGERVDLTRLVEQIELIDDKLRALDTSLEAYERALDAVLRARLDISDNKMKNIQEHLRKRDMEALRAEELKEFEARSKVRDVNAQWAEHLATELIGADGDRLRSAYRRACFPMIYRERQVRRTLDAAMKLDDLTPEQIKGLTALSTRLYDDSATINHQMEDAVRKQEEATLKSMQIAAEPGDNGGRIMMSRVAGDDDAMQALRAKRRTLEEGITAEMQKLLTDAQRAKLPAAKPSEPDAQPRMRFGL